MVEGAPLLRAYGGKTSIEGSNPSLSAKYKTGPCAPFFVFVVMGVERSLRFDQRYAMRVAQNAAPAVRRSRAVARDEGSP